MRVCLFRHSRQKRAKAIPARSRAPNRSGDPRLRRPPGRPVLARPGYDRRNPTTLGPRPTGAEDWSFQRGREEVRREWPAEVRAATRAAGLRSLRPGVPQRRPARGDLRGPPARVRQQRADPVASAPDGRPTTSTSSCPAPTSTGLSPYDSTLVKELTTQLQEHAREAELHLLRAHHDHVRGRRRPHHRALPGPQPRARVGDQQRHPYPGTPSPAPTSRSTARAPAPAPGPGRRAAAPRPTCASTTPASVAGTSSSPSTSPPTAACPSPSQTSARPTACSSTATASPALRSTTAPRSRSGVRR